VAHGTLVAVERIIILFFESRLVGGCGPLARPHKAKTLLQSARPSLVGRPTWPQPPTRRLFVEISHRARAQLRMKHYERRLPHFEVIDQPLFVTFRLDGSLPGHRVFPPAQVTDGKSFLAMDRILDAAATGPRFLAIPEIAARGFGFMDLEHRFERCEMHSFVVMPNHVHALVTPRVEATKWLAPLKRSPLGKRTCCWTGPATGSGRRKATTGW